MKKLIGWLIIAFIFGGLFFYYVATDGLIAAVIPFIGAFALVAIMAFAVALIMPDGFETLSGIIKELRGGEDED
jgi:hypothetical protein